MNVEIEDPVKNGEESKGGDNGGEVNMKTAGKILLGGLLILVFLGLVFTGQRQESTPQTTGSPTTTAIGPVTTMPSTTESPATMPPATEPPTTVPPETGPPALIYNVGEVVHAKIPATEAKGEKYDDGNITFLISKVRFGSSDPSYHLYKYEKGSKYCVMDVTIANVGDSKVNFFYGVLYPDIKDGAGGKYTVNSVDLSWNADILPGEEIRGDLYAKVPADVVGQRKLVFIADTEPQITIALN